MTRPWHADVAAVKHQTGSHKVDGEQFTNEVFLAAVICWGKEDRAFGMLLEGVY
jgi:hypothetical protein